MPELPEVETTKEGIKAHIEGQIISKIMVRNPNLRIPVPLNINELCATKQVIRVTRRAKYLLIQLSQGFILIHLGMSGHLRIVPSSLKPEKHDHIDVHLGNNLTLRYCDPRRFGLFCYINNNPLEHPLLAHLGPEPLTDDFNGNYLNQKAQNKKQAIKSFIMNNHIVVGVGNIYASESLYLAGVNPQIHANQVSQCKYMLLAEQIKSTLRLAIESGGTTLRDFYSFDGKPGYFSMSLKVYGRKNKPCFHCNHIIESVVIAGRQSAFCPNCQPVNL